ncbi:unnamed protein product [Linum tenue]|uniref:Uncharacterized protein n=1 Tax=Linum tenue TaxID=586396 RepID=A0AAV0KA98_9ROSI|nr:unnamed protein product [Linum tenue]
MEGVSATVYTKMKRYWKRQGYHRIDGGIRQVELGGGGRRRRRISWRVKIKPKLKFMDKLASPKRFFIWLRDAYVRMMLGFANSAGGAGMVGDGGVSSFGRKAVKEYDEKMILQIYKSLVLAQANRQQLAAPAAGAPDRCGGSSPSVAAAKLAAIVE